VRAISSAILVLLISSCATAPTALTPSGGSRSDAVVELSHSTGVFSSLVIDWEATDKAAKDRCVKWGFRGAERFSNGTKSCVERYDQDDCLRYEHVYKYQCLD
jgi:hypothetical protein